MRHFCTKTRTGWRRASSVKGASDVVRSAQRMLSAAEALTAPQVIGGCGWDTAVRRIAAPVREL